MEKNNKKEPLKLQEAVAKKYELVGVAPGTHNCPNFGRIDLCALTLKDANALVLAKFPYLKLKGKPEAEEVEAKPIVPAP